MTTLPTISLLVACAVALIFDESKWRRCLILAIAASCLLPVFGVSDVISTAGSLAVMALVIGDFTWSWLRGRRSDPEKTGDWSTTSDRVQKARALDAQLRLKERLKKHGLVEGYQPEGPAIDPGTPPSGGSGGKRP